MKIAISAVLVLAAAFVVPADSEKHDLRRQWPQWRGPLGNGVAPRGDPPLRWSEQENVRWKIELPGRGHSTPVIWGDRVFITTAVPFGELHTPSDGDSHGAHDNVPAARRQKSVVLAVDRQSGAILWQKTVNDDRPHESMHVSASWASASAVTDGEHLIVSFGSRGVYGLGLDGVLLWSRDLGDMRIKHGHGEGSSPALHGDTVVLNWDHEEASFVIALDKRTGEQRWKVSREEATSWSTPLIVEHQGKAQVIVSATTRVRAYDLANGDVIWECGGLSGNVVASPVAGNGYVYVANSYDTKAMLAIRLSAAKGDITGSDAVAWTRNRDTPYVPSPLLYGGTLCFLKHYQGLLTCVDAQSGKTQFGPQRLPGIREVYASPVGAAGRIYIVDRDGTTLVIKHAATFEPLAQNQLDDSFSASPAIVGNELYLRGQRQLYCVAAPPPE